MRTRIEIHKNGTLAIPGSAEILNGCFIRVGENASLSIGEGTYVNTGTRISSSEAVTIGARCAIGFDVVIMDNDYHRIVTADGVKAAVKPILIGDHVWVGARAIILKGVTIGENSVVAAGTVVTQDVPPDSVVGGSPMRVLREGVQWL